MRVAVFDYVPSNILKEVDLPDWVDVLHFDRIDDPVAAISGTRPFPSTVFVAQPPGATIGYAVAAALRDAYPSLRLIGVKTADAHREGFEKVGCDAVVEPSGITGDLEKQAKAAEKAAAKAAKDEAAADDAA